MQLYNGLLGCRYEKVSSNFPTAMQLTNPGSRPVSVNPVIVETEEEKRLFAMGERNSAIRKEQGKTSLVKHTPNDDESDLIHAIWQKQVTYHGTSTRNQNARDSS